MKTMGVTNRPSPPPLQPSQGVGGEGQPPPPPPSLPPTPMSSSSDHLQQPQSPQQPYERLEGAEAEVQDRYLVAYIIFYIQGIGQLFPWNAFITAGSYYRSRFCGTPHSHDFENYFSVTFMLSNLISQALLVRYDSLVVSLLSVRVRMLASLSLLAAIFLTTTLLVLDRSLDPSTLFGFTNLCVALCGVCTSFLQGGMFGYAALFPPHYTQAIMAGQGLAGLIVSVAGIITAAGSTADGGCSGGGPGGKRTCSTYDEVDGSSLAYFSCAVVILLACIVSFLYLETLPIAKFYSSSSSSSSSHNKSSSSRRRRLKSTTAITNHNSSSNGISKAPSSPSPSLPSEGGEEVVEFGGEGRAGSLSSNSSSDYDDDEEEGGGGRGVGVRATLIQPGRPSSTSPVELCSSPSPSSSIPSTAAAAPLMYVLWQLRVPGFSVLMVFLVTLSIFPAVTEHILSVNRCRGVVFYDKVFVPFQFLLFNLFDWMGRSLAGWLLPRRPPSSSLATLSLLRLGFFPLFLLCNVESSAFPVLFRSDAWPTLFMVAFALSNGYLSSLAMMDGPMQLTPPTNTSSHKELAGTTMVLLLTLGLTAGSGLSFLVSGISEGNV